MTSTSRLLCTVLMPYLLICMGCDSASKPAAQPTTSVASVEEINSERHSLIELAGDSESKVVIKRRGDSIVVADLREVTDASTLQTATSASVAARVEEVLLKGTVVTDEMVEPLTSLTSLKRLRAEKTSLGDLTASLLSKGNRLELLYLTDASGLTESGAQAIFTMTTLRNLRVGGATVTDQSINGVASLPNLSALGLLNCNVTDEGVKRLADCSKVKELMLFNTAVTDASFETFTKMPSLQTLRLRQSKVTGKNADALAKLGIVELELAETDFGNEGMDSIRKMPKLTKVNSWLTKIDNDGVKKLDGMTQLTSLNLDNLPPVDDKALETIVGLPNLEFLHLGKTSVTPEGLQNLAALKNLKTLLATQLNVTDSQAAALKKAIPSLERFDY